jgi:hypothetical protein
MDAGATCFLLPKKHQSAWHRPDNSKRDASGDGAQAFSASRQAEWRTGNPAERQGRGTGTVQAPKKKDWNISSVVEGNQRFPDRRQERQLSAFQAIPQYDYNFRAEVLPKAELKGAPKYDKFHLDMTGGDGPAQLRTSTNNFIGMSANDSMALGTKMSCTTRTQLPIHPGLDAHHTIWNTGDRDWKISNQVVPKERQAAFEALDAKASRKAAQSRLRATTGGRGYRNPQQLEADRAEEIRRLKTTGKFVGGDGKPFLHTYRMDSTLGRGLQAGMETAGGASVGAGQLNDSLDAWAGQITFATTRAGGVRTRTRWNYAAPT